MSLLTNEYKFPCKYTVVKYIDDEIKDEPINVGVILQSQRNYETVFKFVTQNPTWKIANMTLEARYILEGLVSKLEQELSSSSNDKNILNNIPSIFEGKLRFSETRGTLTANLFAELDYLFDRLLTLRYQEHSIHLSNEHLIRQVIQNIREVVNAKNVRRNYPLRGKMSTFSYDVAVVDRIQKYFEAISFYERTALEKTKLFDWSVRDSIQENSNLDRTNFIAVICKPSPELAKYEKLVNLFEEGKNILSTYEHPYIVFGKDDSWKNEIQSYLKQEN